MECSNLVVQIYASPGPEHGRNTNQTRASPRSEEEEEEEEKEEKEGKEEEKDVRITIFSL